MYSKDYLRLTKFGSKKLKRIFNMTIKLPSELQMILHNRIYNRPFDFISLEERNIMLCDLFKYYII